MDPLLFLGSLVAILALAGIARWLGLGRAPKLASEDDARRAAGEAVDGFEPFRIALDEEGDGALLESASGQILLLKPHGNFFAGRVLGPRATAVLVDEPGEFNVVIDSGEQRFGRSLLTIENPAYWVSAIERLKAGDDA